MTLKFSAPLSFPQLKCPNAFSVDLVKTSRITDKLSALKEMLKNKPPYWQEANRSVMQPSAYSPIRLFLKKNQRTSKPSQSLRYRVRSSSSATRCPAFWYKLENQWTSRYWRHSPRVKKVPTIVYRQPWRTCYSAQWRRSWPRSSS